MPHAIVKRWPGKRIHVALAGLLWVFAGCSQRETFAGGTAGEKIAIQPGGTEQASQGSSEYFTGSALVEPLFAVAPPSRIGGARVTFEPGARTAWHAHPLGQVLIVTDGTGWVQQSGGAVREIRQGDVVRIPPGQKHWHGATATTGMTHLALQEELDGRVVEWMEKVSDEQYRGSEAGNRVEKEATR